MDRTTEQFEEASWKMMHGDIYEGASEYYDITQQFLDAFQILELDSFESLKLALRNFTEETGYAYTIKRSKRYRENDIRRNLLIYNHICYGCTLHVQGSSSCSKQPEIPCPSQINFTSVKGVFKVAKFVMIHNHPPPITSMKAEIDSSTFPAFIDCSDKFREAFPGMSAGSYMEFTNRLKGFEKATGSVYIKYSSGLFGDTEDHQQTICKYKKLRYVCVHYGSRRSEPIRRRNQHTTKIGCGSCFSVKYANGRLHIVSYDMRHCHPVDPESAMLYPHNRRLTPVETAEIEQLLAYNPNMGDLKHHIKEKYGKICTTRDIINMRFRRKKRLENAAMSRVKAGDAFDENDAHPSSSSSLSDPPTASNLESLVDICCQQQQQQHQQPEGSPDASFPPPSLTPVLHDIQQLAEAAPVAEVMGFHSVLRNLANAWRRGQQPIVIIPKNDLARREKDD